MKFCDYAKILIKSGKGGDGCISFRREKFIPRGGPNGNKGGWGGNVYAVGNKDIHTLSSCRKSYIALNGKHGLGRNKVGRNGEDITLSLPLGTEIWDSAQENILFDIVEDNQKCLLLTGGKPGLGNISFKNSANRAPRTRTLGEERKEKYIVLKLKYIADVGFIGFPNVGKSTLLSVISSAKPDIANYAFTTLHPNLGVLSNEYYQIMLADLPGIIEGAHEGKGLGLRFLGHAERCFLLAYVLDVCNDPVRKYTILKNEIHSYSHKLLQKNSIIILNKIDLLSKEEVDVIQKEIFHVSCNPSIFCVSAKHARGIDFLSSNILRANVFM